MKRHQFGINVDEGVALSTAEEFEMLFVDTQSESRQKLLDWIANDETPVLFGGQIGSGKSTLIEFILRKSDKKPDLLFHFDRYSVNLSVVDCWKIVFVELFRYLATFGCTNIEEIPNEYKEILGKTSDSWIESISQIRLETFSRDSVEKSKSFSNLLEADKDYLPDLFVSLVNKTTSVKGSTLFFFASGVDKFEPGTAAFFSLTEILQSLRRYKTLFEVNAVHLFSGDSWTTGLEKIILTPFTDNQIEKMLKKRLGAYSKSYLKEIPLISKYSGGLPRQAVRLLDYFLINQKKAKNRLSALNQAVENVNRDFFAFSLRPENILLQNVNNKRFLETNMISLSGDTETAKRAVFGNWIILNSHLTNNRWEAIVNPIVKGSFFEIEPEEPEFSLLKNYARQAGISEFGLDGNAQQFDWQNTLLARLESPVALNITDILDSISAALLSKQRADRVIVAYENQKVFEAVRAYLEAKSNTYEYQIWRHCKLDSEIESPLLKMLEYFSETFVDVFSFEFSGDFPQNSLDELNIRRDSFIDKQLIWWIPKNKLRIYLERWTQLRQLFQVYVLEEDLAKSLTIENVQSDLDFMKELVESENSSASLYVKNLQIVLDYLKEVMHG
ncbi:MAG: hypothetical protein HQM10_26090 [Candidatus Riflebacteria bacterium]|nr:hypothetical protein [Candidatus Riflebacteria bacterium]